ncbi:MAG: ABC transporter ATP-binding protein [Oscillospiraceae bacterium]
MGLIRFLKPYKWQFTIGSAAKLAEAFLELYLPILMAQILDVGIPSGDKSQILATGGRLLLFSAIGFLCASICQFFASVTSQATGTDIRDAMMRKISTFSYRELDTFGTSSLINRITTDVNNYQQAVAMTIRLVTRAPFICIGAVVMAVSIDPGLSIIFVGLIPILGLLLYLLMRASAPLYRKVQQRLDGFALVVRENLSGVRVIRAFARTNAEETRAKGAASELADANIKVGNLSALMQPATSIVLNLGIILVLYLGARQVFDGIISQGDLLALTTYATKILYALIVIANIVGLFTKASASTARISEVLSTEPSVTDSADIMLELPKNAPCLEFSDASFAYNGGENALSNITFRMERGQTMGVVGVTGSGKTTLISLIQRFYDVQKGSVQLLGADVRDYPQAELRSKIGVVPQTNVLFSGTIAENLRIGNQVATEIEMIAALKTAQCWEFVSSLPEGIHSPIFEGGKNFSGGQRQRLAIARALVRRPELLILDDSLSALDYKTDLALRRALREDMAGISILIVSQRISSVLSADRILVLEQGALAGLGTHEELLRDCVPYREIYESQVDDVGAQMGGQSQ